MYIFFNNVYITYVLTHSVFAVSFLCVFSFKCHKLILLVFHLLKALLTATEVMEELVSGRSKLDWTKNMLIFYCLSKAYS